MRFEPQTTYTTIAISGADVLPPPLQKKTKNGRGAAGTHRTEDGRLPPTAALEACLSDTVWTVAARRNRAASSSRPRSPLLEAPRDDHLDLADHLDQYDRGTKRRIGMGVE